MGPTSERCQAVCTFEESRGHQCHEGGETARPRYSVRAVTLCWTHKRASENPNRETPLETI